MNDPAKIGETAGTSPHQLAEKHVRFIRTHYRV
jgi:hypothetical protein